MTAPSTLQGLGSRCGRHRCSPPRQVGTDRLVRWVGYRTADVGDVTDTSANAQRRPNALTVLDPEVFQKPTAFMCSCLGCTGIGKDHLRSPA